MAKKVLITGGAGFIGSNFVSYLANKYPNYKLWVLDALTYAGRLENIPNEIRESKNFHFVKGDIRDRKTVEDLVKQVDSVVHLAAETHVRYSLEKADIFMDTNVRGTSILCEAIIKYPIKRFIHISSSEVYGTAQEIPMDEKHPLLPCSPYAGSKAGAERVAYSFYSAYDIPLIILRPFNNYGPYQHFEKVIPHFIVRALENRPLFIHDDGLQTRDWVYVNDHSEAIDSAVHAPIDKLKGEVINIGTGKDTSILTIAKMILSFLGKPESLIKYGESRPGQVRKHMSSTKKSKQLLNWQPRVTIKEGLEKTIQWYADNHDWWQNVKKR